MIRKQEMVLCTYFDSSYLARGLALHASLSRHWPDVDLLVLCLDVIVESALRELALPRVRILSLAQLERIDPELLAVRETRSRIGYYLTCTPVLLRYALRDADSAIYLDADLYFFGSPSPVLEEFARGSIYVHQHRPDGAEWDRTAGRFNVGLVAVRNDDQGRACVDRWREQCLEWCENARVDGRFGDQKYLDEWPSQFNRLVVARHRGVGALVDSLGDLHYAVDDDGTVRVDGVPLVFFHFTLLKEIAPAVVRTYGTAHSGRPLDVTVRFSVYGPYLREVRAQVRRLARLGYRVRAFDRQGSAAAARDQSAPERKGSWRRAMSLARGFYSGELMLSWGSWVL